MVVVSALVTGGCTESLEGYEGSVSGGGGVSVRIAAVRPDGVTLGVSRPTADAAGNPRYVRPYDAILKVAGYLPQPPEGVAESAEGFTFTMRLPADLVKALRANPLDHQTILAELILPVETGITSFAGVEHYAPRTTYHQVTLHPVYSGPLSSAAKGVGEWLRGLYAAR